MLNTVSNKVFLRKLPDATFQEGRVVVDTTLYIGLAKDQRIGIGILPYKVLAEGNQKNNDYGL